MQMTIGVDVGNFDTKSKNTSTVSGYTVYESEQLLANKVLEYDGKYYVESIDNRLPFVEDKTAKDQCLILTLIAIAKEQGIEVDAKATKADIIEMIENASK